jgi:tetraacyldisaccharide 4'-kinase
VVSVGNLTVGGTGKTTLTLHLARLALARGVDAAVVCRRYRPGAAGRGDEELLYAAALGEERVRAGSDKRALAESAAAAGRRLILVDDGFSHWPLERDLDVVLLDARDPWGGGRLLPAGRLREPLRALQRAEVVVLTRLDADLDLRLSLEAVRRYAPAAELAAGRHRIAGIRGLTGATVGARGPARVVTGTGNPGAVARSAREAGFDPVALAAYHDHHAFTVEEARRELARARRDGATLVITPKDEMRWPPAARVPGVAVLEVAWEWVSGGERLERRVLDLEERT